MIVPIIDEWSATTNFWLHRSTLIFQLKYKHQTDLELLEKQINRFKNNNEFFIQKAIGWSLREVSKTNPDWTRNAIERLEIKGLAKREASKHLQEL
jgi:3-methyladenine DNA glycosylase AlkD